MSHRSPRHAKRVLDPETSDIDALALAAADELRDKREPICPESIASALGVPVSTIELQWGRLREIVLLDGEGSAP